MTILVTGATGKVGRHIVDHLLSTGQQVRALTRDPSAANLPAGVEVARGDLSDAATLAPALEGVTALHLITFAGYQDLTNGEELVELARKAGVQRVTVLRGWDETSVQEALRASDLPWTHVQVVEFMGNALEWAPGIRDGGVVREFSTAPSALIHEGDIGAVAATALTEDGHAGKEYLLTGPEALTPAERVAIIAKALGRDVRVVQLTEQELRTQLSGQGYSAEDVEFAVQLGANPPQVGQIVRPDVEQATGKPARTFEQWVAENIDAFRA
ncbi:NmrA family NAD(P)-binding protein [Kibdelosporangium phytohabitans]|uniref:Hydroxylase n=1 Tax=Kibdelosporangium phytohabitans TaxID=860235 RepID=A0A0N9I556_9PSEU|nr:NmrA family NAD(P)-binding protein [Kibdelosporangium phytohabitans]ALG09718.1 hydroxylase [Kibdelosporangium phytohabitans]MBE1468923.1 uncharacterized protein YbjT (DUF2867 family) [Kibdelosporangium phytohabitans]